MLFNYLLNEMSSMDGRIVAIGLAVTSGLIYVRIFENEFFKDIIVVAIPAMVGLFIAKRVPNEWQRYRFKVSLKKEIIDMYEKSVKKSFVIYDNASVQLGKQYAVSEQPIDPNTGEIKLNISFPTDPSKQPLIALKDEYAEFKKDVKEIKINGEILVLKMKLYFNNKDVGEKFQKMNIQAGKCSQYIRQGFESTNKESFLTNLNTFNVEIKNLRKLSNEFESTLAQHKITKTIV